jgi:hypothetical protein
LSTATYRPENIDNNHLTYKNVHGKSRQVFVLGIPVSGSPKLDHAVAEALKNGKGDYMQNAQLYTFWWSVILFGSAGFEVEGDVFNTMK